MTPEQQRAIAIAKAKRARAAAGNASPQQAAPDGFTRVQDVGDGAIYRSSSGAMSFKSPSYATSNPDEIAKMMQGGDPAASAQSLSDQSTLGMNPQIGMGGAAANFLQGVPFAGQYLDEGVGLLKGEGAQNDVRTMQGVFERQNPKTALGLKVAGGITGSIPAAVLAGPALSAAAPTSLLGQSAFGLGVGSLSGAAEGAVSGYGSGVDDASRVENAKMGGIVGGGLGGVLGAAAPLLAAGIKAGAGKILDRVNGGRRLKAAGLDRPSYDVLSRAMEADGSLAGAGQSRIAAGGADAMLADAGPNARTLLDTAIQKSGRAGVVAQGAIEQRATKAGGDISTALDDVLGAPGGIRAAARNIASTSAPARKAAYDAAYASPIDYAGAGRQVEDVLARVPNRILKSAVSEANEAMQAAGVKNMQIMADIADDGKITFREMPNVQQLDEIKKALGTISATEVDQFGRKTAAGNRAAGLASDLREAIGNAVPGYKNAVNLGGDKIAEDNALALGANLFKPSTTREIVGDATKGITDAERKAMMKGVRSNIDESLSQVKRAISDGNVDAREAIKAVRDLSSRANREKLKMVVGDNQAKKLFAEIDKSVMALDLRAGVSQNSKTFARTSMDDIIKGQTDGTAIQALKSGEPVNAAKRVVQILTGSTPEAKIAAHDKIYSQIVDVLTKTRGAAAAKTLDDLLGIMKTVKNNDELAKTISRRLTSAAALPAYQTGMQSAGSQGRQ